jgi:hypothetical protein
MSLAGAIEALRKAVPSVSPETNRTELTEATPIGVVPPEEAKDRAIPEDGTGRERAPDLKNENGEVSNFSLSRNLRNPSKRLSDPALAELVSRAAWRFGLTPADLWAFLSLDDLEALRTGRPEELRAILAFAESRSRTGERTTGGHDLPFPGAAGAPAGLKPVCCGDCAHFRPDTVGDGSGIEDCGKGIEARGRPRYPGTERYCRGFADRRQAGYRTGTKIGRGEG